MLVRVDLLPEIYATRVAPDAPRIPITPEDTLTAVSRPSSIIRYTVARQTLSRSATSRTVRNSGFNAEYCDGIVKSTLESGPPVPTRWEPRHFRPGGSADTWRLTGMVMTPWEPPAESSGPRGRRFKSCLPDLEALESTRVRGLRLSRDQDTTKAAAQVPEAAARMLRGTGCEVRVD